MDVVHYAVYSLTMFSANQTMFSVLCKIFGVPFVLYSEIHLKRGVQYVVSTTWCAVRFVKCLLRCLFSLSTGWI